ncbi:uncharacterized protein LOC119557838 [Drosophila subpulchrella]|uniref:uncharacterized protein LOC119557838 n=1 Tax=Drosophila subpulchrella TaxID=1486046 RepID=UPI0018A150D8|nr:uncharacterized protein LOC119557838 [Drosophila subpulchrella]
MCLILPLDCCGCSSPRSCQRQKKEQQEQHLQHQAKNYHSDIQLNELSSACQVTTSQPSLSSLSPSLMALPHRITTSSTLSSWAGEEELYDMEDYEDRTPSRWNAWWLTSFGDQGCHSSVAS